MKIIMPFFNLKHKSKKSKILLLSLTFLFSLFVFNSYAQIYMPVKWSFSTRQISKSEAELIFTSKIETTWHLYAQDLPKDGPIPTSFKFNPSGQFKLIGKVTEQKGEIIHDDNFNMDLKVFNKSAEFKQKIKILSAKDFKIDGSLEFMCCDNKRCLPPEDVDFSFDLAGNPEVSNQQTAVSSQQSPVSGQQSAVSGQQSAVSGQQSAVSGQQSAVSNQQITKATDKLLKANNEERTTSLWSFFIIALIAGFAGTLTPCVFPMIPMTVTFFVNSKTHRRKSIFTAIVYGLSIIFIYTLIGLLVSLLKSDADTLNRISTHWITNMIFFMMFIFFAASFFGMFEITLPSWVITRSDKKADKGGYIGAFFMALTLVLVSFSCTGPIVGTILIEAATGMMLKPVIGMFGFGLAFAIPFIILALFPSWMGKLPKSGGWLNSVKIVMAFIILALSLKFFVSADQTYHWDILSRNVFLAIWIVLFTMLGFYLLGKLRFKHDNEVSHISFFRVILSVISFVFVIYLFTGLFGANLNVISGFLPPPSNELIFNKEQATTNNEKLTTNNELCETPKYANLFQLPYNLHGYFDYKQGLECAKKLHKPMFVAFTGHACSNCHKMENNVWSDPEVLKRLNEGYVVVMLYVDDRTDLPQSEWVTSTFDGKVKNTIGKVNADFRITRYKANTQPFYVLLDDNEKLLSAPMEYDLNVSHFVNFLDTGINKFKGETVDTKTS